MKRKSALILAILFFQIGAFACSMYKITVGDKTMVGCNEDAYRLTPRIWFETAQNSDKYGACFTGSRVVGHNQFAPQSGMNEMGLVFSRLASYHPEKVNDTSGKKQITDPIDYLKTILHTCKNVDEVKQYITQFDHSYFMEDVFIYIDKSGKYLVVEPYELLEGNDPNYVLSNFCPSITTNEKARKLDRYRAGEDFFKNQPVDTSFSYCASASEAMKVCRKRNGDGTLLTSIWDSKAGKVNLYFYHSFDTTVQFDIAQELKKGDHILNIVDLFPPNQEFDRLASYKHPFNVPALRVSLIFFALFFVLSSLFFFISYVRRAEEEYRIMKLLLSFLGLVLAAYMAVLATNMGIYYFDAPYVHYSNDLISAFSYTPFLLMLCIVPIYILNGKLFNRKIWTGFLRIILAINALVYTFFLLLFFYWGLFDVIN